MFAGVLATAVISLAIANGRVCAQDRNSPAVSHAELLPAETIVAVSIVDFDRFRENWSNSGLNAYLSHDGVSTTLRSVYRQSNLNSFWLTAFDPETISEFVAEQVTYAAVASDTSIEICLIMDIDDNTDAARRWQESVRERLEGRGATSSELAWDGDVRALKLTHRDDSHTTTLVFVQHDSRLIVGSSERLAQYLVKTSGASLASSESYSQSVRRALNAEQNSDISADFWWFVDPLGFIRALERPANQRPRGQLSTNELARIEKFDAVKAIGGRGVLGKNEAAISASGFIVADKPFQRAARLFEMDNDAIPETPNWFAHATSSGFVNLKFESFLENYSTMFDTLYGEGETGIFELVLEELKQDPKGPQLDLRQEVFSQLQTPLFYATFVDAEASPTLFGVKVRDAAAVTRALEKMYQGDPDATKVAGLPYAAWQVEPLDELDVGIRESYVVAIREQFVLIAPRLDVIESAFQRGETNATDEGSIPAKRESSARESGASSHSFAFDAQSRTIARFRHQQVAEGRLTGLLGRLFEKLELDEALKDADRSDWPEFDKVGNKLPRQLKVRGKSTNSGWELQIDLIR